jgi:hypothetical protein
MILLATAIAAAFAIPNLDTLGNLGRYNIRGVGEWAFDASMSRIFQSL